MLFSGDESSGRFFSDVRSIFLMGEPLLLFFFGAAGLDSVVAGFCSSADATITGSELFGDDSESDAASAAVTEAEEVSSVEFAVSPVSSAPVAVSFAVDSAETGPRCCACPHDSIRGFK